MSDIVNTPADEPAANTENAPPRRILRGHLLMLAAGVLLLAAGAGISQLIATHTQRDAVVFDMRGTIDAFKQQSARRELDENSARALTQRFSQALDCSLQAWQQDHNALVLTAGAVVSPAQDITPVIQADIARRMQEAP
ncbi:conjugal transfer protein (plasmid) [Erwinia billingiae Eb661]|uniref:Conjugal transfer protein n=1 Tax=Erwinia billingiae (strain Eb661) TaxID=634500 RepID=D8MK54_ERWBE|nr:type-F conjugative transfer system protein TrbI [Erwinia billingiae]CAX53652.1 conjugal transfer protein [Erwinia billingiae Eb661]